MLPISLECHQNLQGGRLARSCHPLVFGFQASLASHGSRSFLTLPSPSRLFCNGLSDPTIPRGRYIPSSGLLRAGCASKSAALSGLRWARRGVTQAADAREAERHLRHGKVQFQKACSPEACDGVERQKGLARRRDADRHSPPVRNELRRRTWQAAGCTLAVRTFRSPAVCQSASLPVTWSASPPTADAGGHRRLLAWSAADMVRVGHPRRRRKVTAWRREVERSPRRAASRI
jgi:hypothetical protein